MLSEFWFGCYGLQTPFVDRNGSKINVGDTLVFDPIEWGSEYTFKIEFDRDDGEMLFPSKNDLADWCTIVKKWYED